MIARYRLSQCSNNQMGIGIVCMPVFWIVSTATLLIPVLPFPVDQLLKQETISDEITEDEREIRELYLKLAEACNKSDWETYVGLLSDDSKRLWILSSVQLSTAADLRELEARNRLSEHDEEYRASLRHFIRQLMEGDEREADRQYALEFPDDPFVKRFGVSNARLSHAFLEFEHLDVYLVYTLRHFGSYPRPYYGEITDLNVVGNQARLTVKGSVRGALIGSYGVDRVDTDDIEVFMRKIDGEWRIVPFLDEPLP